MQVIYLFIVTSVLTDSSISTYSVLFDERRNIILRKPIHLNNEYGLTDPYYADICTHNSPGWEYYSQPRLLTGFNIFTNTYK